MKRYLWLCAVASSIVVWAACGDDEPALTVGPTSASSTGSGAGGNGGGGGGVMMATCPELCASIFQCGVDSTECAALDAVDQQPFLSDTCNPWCATDQMALQVLVNAADCDGTVTALKSVNDDFTCVCDNGVASPLCGAGGMGGAGGGAGGN